MPKLLNYAQAVARKQQPATTAKGPRVNPAEIWINRHKPGNSREATAQALSAVARLLGYGDGAVDDWRACPWHALKYEDAERVRALLLESITTGEYVPGTANSRLAALKGVMVEVWRIGADTVSRAWWSASIAGRKAKRRRRRQP
mgnify:CR=1 FL=1